MVSQRLRAELEGVSSHSLKCTLLSWASKFGLPADVRRFLGHHTKSEDGSLLIYGRDNAAGPLRSLEMMLSAVRAGAFVPDLTRSGRFIAKGDRTCIPSFEARFAAPAPVAFVPGVLSPVEVPELVDLSDSDSSSDSEDEIPFFEPGQDVAEQDAEAGPTLWVHCKLGTVHTSRPGLVDIFVCGRKKHDGHAMLPASEDLSPYHCCIDCSR
jgi:hypothetical protein